MISTKEVKKAVKTAVADDDRSKRSIIFELREGEEGKEDDLVDTVEAAYEKTGVVPFFCHS